jgi:hypothetical protein
LQGGNLEPMRVSYVDEEDGGPVNVEVLAGMAAPPPESAEPEEISEGDNRFGWYVVCNGRPGSDDHGAPSEGHPSRSDALGR